jgi:hypothetical protein
MAKTTFTDKLTTILAAWLNEVNTAVFDAIGDGTNAPTTGAQVRTNIGAGNVEGPATSTDGGFAKFDGTTGDLLKDSAAVVAVADGGTGQSSYTDGQLLIGNTTGNTLAKGTLTGGTGITVTNGGGTITIDADNNGDVVGPASATDNAVVRFDLTTGKLIQDSVLIIADTTGALSRSGDGGIPVQGTNTNDSAAAGYVGEVISSIVTTGSAISLTTNTSANITSISLTPGDWDISGFVGFVPAATTSVNDFAGSVDTTSATLSANGFRIFFPAFVPGSVNSRIPLPTLRHTVSATTTYYLVALANFTVSTMVAYGTVIARRAR